MHTYARLAPGPGFKAHRTLFYYTQRLVTFWPARDAVSGCIARAAASRPWPWRLRAGRGGSRRARRSRARRSGRACAARAYGDHRQDARLFPAQRQAVLGTGGARMQLEELPPETPEAGYDLKTIIACPDLMELVNAPAVLQLACAYLHCKPTLSSLGVRWSLPGSGTEALISGLSPRHRRLALPEALRLPDPRHRRLGPPLLRPDIPPFQLRLPGAALCAGRG